MITKCIEIIWFDAVNKKYVNSSELRKKTFIQIIYTGTNVCVCADLACE